MVTPRVWGCDLTALVAGLVEPVQQNQNELACGKEKT